jgi:hypothetical protein
MAKPNKSNTEPSSSPSGVAGKRHRKLEILVVLLATAFSALGFIVLDYVYTSYTLKGSLQKIAARRTRVVRLSQAGANCRTKDPVMEHAFRPNCATIERWGADSYDVFTNNLALRDQRVREVPPIEHRPRLLMLGDSFTEGKIDWDDSFVGRIASRFPQYEILNGGVTSYSPSNYLNVTLKLLAAGIQFDEVIVFLDISDVQDEASYYQDAGEPNAVTGPEHRRSIIPQYGKFREYIDNRFLVTSRIFQLLERMLIRHAYYHLNVVQGGNIFDLERSAWTYRKVSETYPFDSGYAPLGSEGGIAREKEKLAQLQLTLAERHIPLSIAVYPWPAQLVHDTPDSRQVTIWRDWCSGTCKRFISVFPQFFAVKKQCPASAPGCWYESLFVFGDYHFNRAGNVLVADAVAQSLEAVPPAPFVSSTKASP